MEAETATTGQTMLHGPTQHNNGHQTQTHERAFSFPSVSVSVCILDHLFCALSQGLEPRNSRNFWKPEEDEILVNCIDEGMTKWSEMAKRIPSRNGTQCRARWYNALDPSLNKGAWTEEEDRILIEAHATLGSSSLSARNIIITIIQITNNLHSGAYR